MVSGLALPVCDCAIIPLFKALTDRGVPLSVAIPIYAPQPNHQSDYYSIHLVCLPR